METTQHFETLPSNGCECCQFSSEIAEEAYGCKDRMIGIFTLREHDVLRRIRELRERVRGLKEYIRQLSSGDAEGLAARETAVRELDKMKEQRAQLEAERIAAADERMRLLGHL